MLSLRTATFIFSILGFLTLCAPPSEPTTANAIDRRYTLEFVNASEVEIHNIYMTSSQETSWGSDLLKEDILSSQKTFKVWNIIPGEYDLMFVDEDDRKCIVRDFQVFQNGEFEITDDWLDSHCKS